MSTSIPFSSNNFVSMLLNTLFQHGLLPTSNEADDEKYISSFIDIFQEYFIQSTDALLDDLLFFVKSNIPIQSHSSDKNEKHPPNDRIFVKRNLKNGSLPPLNDLINWKETVYLNLINQLNTKLIVSICQKNFGASNSEMKITQSKIVSIFPSPSRIKFGSREMSHEFSYPYIYFNVGDFEHFFGENFLLGPGEYLCTQLILNLSMSLNGSNSLASSLSMSQSDLYPLGSNSTQFPSIGTQINELNNDKIGVYQDDEIPLFEGAVSFDAIWSVYLKKKEESKQKKAQSYFVLMRGPNGKGKSTLHSVKLNTK